MAVLQQTGADGDARFSKQDLSLVLIEAQAELDTRSVRH
jgi:hypothetical protein